MFGYYFHRYIKDAVKFAINTLLLFAAVVVILTAFYTIQRQEEQIRGGVEVVAQLKTQLKEIHSDVRRLGEEKVALEQQLLETSKALAMEQAKTAELQDTVAKAILPESNWKEVGTRRIVEPTVASYERLKNYVQGLF